MRPAPFGAIATGILLCLAGCADSGPTAPVDIVPLPASIIQGVVTSVADTTPVAGASVAVVYWTGSLFGSPSVVLGQGYTGAEGRYRITVGNPPRGYSHDCTRTVIVASLGAAREVTVGSCVAGFPNATIDLQLP